MLAAEVDTMRSAASCEIASRKLLDGKDPDADIRRVFQGLQLRSFIHVSGGGDALPR